MKLNPLITLTGLLWLPLAQAQVDYNIDINDPVHHSADVNVVLNHNGVEPLTVQLPNWRTGKYTILPLADGIRDFAATDANGQPLPWHKSARGQWQVAAGYQGPVTISYSVTATELGQRSRHIDDSHAYLDASGVLMYNPKQRDEALTVSLQVPPSWRSVSGLPRLGEHQFKAANYDVLIDSPIETGIHQSFSFKVDKRDYELVIWGEGNYDTTAMVADLKALAGAAGEYFKGEYPYDYYLFIVHATSGARGATEHLNSTVIQRPRWSFAKRKDYLSFIATAAHELVHTWNVKAYRPQGLIPYDYQRDNYTDMLWFAEGGTSYLQNMWLLRGGVMTTEEYLADVARRITEHRRRPGVAKQTVAQASFDNWIARGGDYGFNNSVSIYSEGYMANWSLDLWLQQQGQSIAQLHQGLYQQHRIPVGYNASQMQTLINKIANKDSQMWWQQHIEQPLNLDFEAMLAQVGLTMKWPTKQILDMGVSIDDDNRLTKVARGGPGWQAGLTAGDQILAINGLRFDGKTWPQQWAQLADNQSVTLDLFRRDSLMSVSVTPTKIADGKLKLVPLAGATAAQQAAFTAWTGAAFPQANPAAEAE
ncbi:PDZ domain-containing protein [uncultured Ferrimonas sp.]|uniref:M61 family metallopeptidase n=1 Tax=uncultured Ferrimonas sp. TaxID=432640 RepID=UPI002604BA09|nr:PDZ domain-containing protein [uncultured Ferrimonas sp.]